MLQGIRFPEALAIEWGSEPKNYTGATGNTDWFSLKNLHAGCFIVQTGAWAGGTAAVTLNQATAVAGTSSKALSFADAFVWSKVGLTAGTFTRTAITSDTFNLSAANTLYVVCVPADSLDYANSFDCVQMAVASPGVNADLYGIIFLGLHRFQTDTPPSVIVD